MPKKLKGVWKRANGTWYFSTKVKKPDGTYENVTKTFRTQREAYEAKEAILSGTAAIVQNQVISRDSFGALVNEFFDFEASRIKTSTLYGKIKVINAHIMNVYKNHSISQVLNSAELLRWKNNLPKVSVQYKNQVIARMKEICNFAYRTNRINQVEYNSCAFALTPIKKNQDINENELISEFNEENKNYITENELYILISAFKKKCSSYSNEYIQAIELIFYTGLRIGELLGLKVNRIDFRNSKLLVASQRSRIPGETKNEDVSLKSSNSKRTILLDKSTTISLKKYIQERKLKETDYLFSFPKSSFFNAVKETSIKVLNKSLSIHGLRHSHCSYLIQLYLDNNLVPDFGAIAKRMGHSVDQTMNTYYHMYPKQEHRLLELIEKKGN